SGLGMRLVPSAGRSVRHANQVRLTPVAEPRPAIQLCIQFSDRSDKFWANKKATKLAARSPDPKWMDEPSPAHRNSFPASGATCEAIPMVLLMQSHGEARYSGVGSSHLFRFDKA